MCIYNRIHENWQGSFYRIIFAQAGHTPADPHPWVSDLGNALISRLALNQATGVFSVVIAPIGDAIGYRRMMLAALTISAVGLLAGGAFPFYGVVLVALFLAGLGKSIYDPALQAFIGTQVPFERRGLVIGVIEMSWAGSSLTGLPLAGLLIARFSLQAPFFALGGMALLVRCFSACRSPQRRIEMRGPIERRDPIARLRYVDRPGCIGRPCGCWNPGAF